MAKHNLQDWHKYWEERALRYAPTDFYKQVARTVNGVSVSDDEIQIVIQQASERLNLCPSDHLLDLCCGNGVLTVRFADSCAQVAGVDYSQNMLTIAQKYHCRKNVHYFLASAEHLSQEIFVGISPFNKVVMVESLHYFQSSHMIPLIESILRVSSQRPKIYFSGILDVEKRHNFYRSYYPDAEQKIPLENGIDQMGQWSEKQALENAAISLGLKCTFLSQDPRLNTAHYRFDLCLEKG